MLVCLSSACLGKSILFARNSEAKERLLAHPASGELNHGRPFPFRNHAELLHGLAEAGKLLAVKVNKV